MIPPIPSLARRVDTATSATLVVYFLLVAFTLSLRTLALTHSCTQFLRFEIDCTKIARR